MERSIKKTLPELSRGLDESLPFPKSGNSARLSSGINSFMVVGAFLQQPALFFSEIRDGINLPQKIWMLLVSSTIFLAVYYSTPETLKQYFDDVKEYNTRVSMINDVVAEDQQVVDQYNSGGSSSLLAVHNELSKIIESWRGYMDQLSVSINTAATVLNVSQ